MPVAASHPFLRTSAQLKRTGKFNQWSGHFCDYYLIELGSSIRPKKRGKNNVEGLCVCAPPIHLQDGDRMVVRELSFPRH